MVHIFYIQSTAKLLGIVPVTVDKYEPKIISTEFLGTFDSKAQVLGQDADSIWIYKNDVNSNLEAVQYDNETTKSIYNDSYLEVKDKYSYFLNGNNAKVVVKTNVKNGKKLLVIKDSYAHNMAQFLVQNYEEVHFVDLRYYNLPMSEYIKQNDITETLILYNVSNLVSDVGIRNLR